MGVEALEPRGHPMEQFHLVEEQSVIRELEWVGKTVQVYVFFGFAIFESFSTHTTSNFFTCRYIYIYMITVILRPPSLFYRGGSFLQKDRKSKIRVYMFFCFVILRAIQY